MPVALSMVLIIPVSLSLTVLALRLVVVTVATVIIPLALLGALLGLSVLASGRVSSTPLLLVWRPRRGRLVRRRRVAVLLLRGLVAVLQILRGHGGRRAGIAWLLGVGLILRRVLGLVILLLARGM